MTTGVQFRGTLSPSQTQRWFTFNWDANQHVLWEVVPDTARPGAAEVDWNVAIERADPAHVTYWITITNLTAANVQFEARYAIIA
ncbi:MAG: hypothetical protein JO307_02885 [Bryobacterales bacterium]|nr:hypothetical protein [Bryobacterales bacterium]MBV9398511.1 hypothetical protein [Bryobacterales bacterium]